MSQIRGFDLEQLYYVKKYMDNFEEFLKPGGFCLLTFEHAAHLFKSVSCEFSIVDFPI